MGQGDPVKLWSSVRGYARSRTVYFWTSPRSLARQRPQAMSTNLPTYSILLPVLELVQLNIIENKKATHILGKKCCHVMKLCIDVDEAWSERLRRPSISSLTRIKMHIYWSWFMSRIPAERWQGYTMIVKDGMEVRRDLKNFYMVSGGVQICLD